ncbi:hypothetical protein [Methanosphaera cuniculi]|uniref:Thoeris protein ThsB TIR-like domain-containing protein n=1 Tax=Methanosphaera cuniculi TaxID=1077256 RepID=A0A2A2HD05_9EURY|nr:hypothetical protein [Methanosphaera cuniculi]PAV07319.1 hypothetical protein ASJ82_00275 [Methanosphaera cuniculi]PWL07889.1 hypothetical protein MSCUN_11320 [Methanosphaera cuniculi]
MIDLFPEEDLATYKLFISYPKDCKDYNIFIERLNTATEAFNWKDVTDIENFAVGIDDCDVVVVLSGLWDDKPDMIREHIKYAKSFNKPIIVVRPYGLEEVPEELQEDATKIIGWNTACIVEAILQSLDIDLYDCPL